MTAASAMPMVDLTVQVDLFSSFYEKLFSNHPDKNKLMSYLDRLKNFIYQNPHNIEKGVELLSELEGEMAPAVVLPSNATYRRESDLSPQYRGAFQHESMPPRAVLEPKGNISNLPMFESTFMGAHKQVTIFKIFDFHTHKIFANADDIYNLIQSSFTHIKEVQKDGNTFFRILGIRYIESLLAEGNESQLARIFTQVYNKSSGMQTLFLTDDITLKEEHRLKFCGYLKQLQNSLSMCGNHYSSPLLLFQSMVNSDIEFLTAILAWCRTLFINFLEDEGNYSFIKRIEPTIDNWKIRNLAHSIKCNMEEPSYIFVKFASHILEKRIRLILVNEHQIVDETYTFGQKLAASSTTISLLCLSNTFTVYYALYENSEVFWEEKEIPITACFKKGHPGKVEVTSRHQTPLSREPVDHSFENSSFNASREGQANVKDSSFSRQQGLIPAFIQSQSSKNLISKTQTTPKTPNPRAIKTFITENNQHMESELNRSSHLEKENRGLSPGDVEGSRLQPSNFNSVALNKSNKRSVSSLQGNEEDKIIVRPHNESFSYVGDSRNDDKVKEANKYLFNFIKMLKENTVNLENKLDVFEGERISQFRVNQKFNNMRQRSPEIKEYSYTTSRLDEDVSGQSTGKKEKSVNKLKSFDYSSPSFQGGYLQIPNLKHIKEDSYDHFGQKSKPGIKKQASIKECSRCEKEYISFDAETDKKNLCNLCHT